MRADPRRCPGDLYHWATGSKASITAHAVIRRRYCSRTPELYQLAVQHLVPSQARAPHVAAVCDQTIKRGKPLHRAKTQSTLECWRATRALGPARSKWQKVCQFPSTLASIPIKQKTISTPSIVQEQLAGFRRWMGRKAAPANMVMQTRTEAHRRKNSSAFGTTLSLLSPGATKFT